MKNRKANYRMIILVTLFIGVQSLQAETLAVILKAEGKVTVSSSGDNNGEQAKRGHRIQEGDQIVTGENSFAALRFIDDASLVRIGANSTCIINGRREGNQIAKNVFVEAGSILSRITQQKGKFQVATPTSVASVKGTEFITLHMQRAMRMLREGTYFFGNDGLVDISNDVGSVDLTPGFTVYVGGKNVEPIKYETKIEEIPTFEELDEEMDEFEMEFEDDSGQKKTVKFKIKKK